MSYELIQVETQDRVGVITLDRPDALNAFSSVTGWEIGYPADLAADTKAPALSGSYTPEQALNRLLAGTGLSYQLTGANTVKLSSAGTGPTGKVSLAPITVESALRSETEYDRLTRSVTVLDQEDVQKQKRTSDRTVGEILAQEVPGFSPSTEANSQESVISRRTPTHCSRGTVVSSRLIRWPSR